MKRKKATALKKIKPLTRKETETKDSAPRIKDGPVEVVAAAANLKRANTDAERKVIECFGVLEVAEVDFTAGQEFGRAVIALRDEIKKDHRRNFLTRLKELEIPYAKARYWMAVVEKKPINRGKATKGATGHTERPDWHEDWSAATAQFWEVADTIKMLAEKQPGGREEFIGELVNLSDNLGIVDWHEDWKGATARFTEVAEAVIMLADRRPEGREEFVGELKNLADGLGYELKAKKGGAIALLQRIRPEGGGVAEGTHGEATDREGGSR